MFNTIEEISEVFMHVLASLFTGGEISAATTLDEWKQLCRDAQFVETTNAQEVPQGE